MAGTLIRTNRAFQPSTTTKSPSLYTVSLAMASALLLYEPLDVIGNGSFGIIRKVRRKSDGVVSPVFRSLSLRPESFSLPRFLLERSSALNACQNEIESRSSPRFSGVVEVDCVTHSLSQTRHGCRSTIGFQYCHQQASDECGIARISEIGRAHV